ncbi:MAG: hypothetical protein ACLQGP_31205 [Isosphaeraceae bacterium]
MARDPSKPARPRSKPPKPSKPQSEPRSWGWGPDGRYTPLTDNGELPLHLPDHLELDRLAQEEEVRAKEWQRRYHEQCRRADRLAAKLRELGIDPDEA